MSLLRPLKTFQTGTYTVTRRTPGTRVDGRWSDGVATTYTDTPMSIRPASGRDLKMLAEGTHVEDVRAVMCEFALRPDDVVEFDGDTWRVFNARDWNVRGRRYVRALMARERVGA